MAPLVAMIPDLKNWSVSEKRDLADIIRAKGGLKERRFILLANRHEKFRRAVEKLSRRKPT